MTISLLIMVAFLQDEDLLVSMQVCLLSYACWLFFPNPRGPSFFEQRLVWERYCLKHHSRGTLKRRLQMDRDSFNKLLGYIYEDLMVKEVMANHRGGPIIPQLCLFCTLRYLAGGSYLNICDIAGISSSSFYRVVWKTINALVNCEEIAIKFATTRAQIQSASTGFCFHSFRRCHQELRFCD
jgi:hypothetical protein